MTQMMRLEITNQVRNQNPNAERQNAERILFVLSTQPHYRTITQRIQHLFAGFFQDWMNDCRSDLAQRLENESSFMHPRVRNHNFGRRQYLLSSIVGVTDTRIAEQ